MSVSRRKVLTIAAPSLVLVAAGCQTAAAPTAPAQPAASTTTDKLLLSADIVQGSKNVPQAQAAMKSCVMSSRFPRNSEIVWRVKVFDPRTADLMDDAKLSGVQVRLANGKTVDLNYGAHPKDPPNEYYWANSWVVPKDAPTGTLRYSVVATGVDGRTGQFEPISVAASLPSITDEVLPDAAA
ncbi:MAG TPA: hypothetical protein VF937_00500 [Chloroflexota bacterium]